MTTMIMIKDFVVVKLHKLLWNILWFYEFSDYSNMEGYPSTSQQRGNR